MAAGGWRTFTRAKRYIGTGAITLNAGVFKLALHGSGASANLLKVSNGGISTWASVGSEIAATGGYVSGGKNLLPATGRWTVGSSVKAMRFTFTAAGLPFSAVGGNLTNVKYAVVRNSTGAGAGKVLCYCTLSTLPFTVASGSILLVKPSATGLFEMGQPPPALPAGFTAPAAHVSIPAGAKTDHPRLLLNSSQVATLRTWATAGNPRWVDLTTLASQYKTLQDNGTLAADTGNISSSSPALEDAAHLFALLANIDPSSVNRTDWASRAHTLIMIAFNAALAGPNASGGWADSRFSTYDRSRWLGECFPLTVDWIYSSFSAGDKATIRQVFLRWVQEQLKANVTNSEHPTPVGTINDPILYNSSQKIRISGNNYYCNHGRNLCLMALAMDAADDVPLNPGGSPAGYDTIPAGYLGDYVRNFIGAHLYIRAYAELHDLAGGVSHEGYQYASSSLGALAIALAALRTAGYDDGSVYGSPAALASTAFWATDVYAGLLHTVSPVGVVQDSGVGGGNPSLLPSVFGDLQDYSPADFTQLYGGLGVYALLAGNSNSYDAARWMFLNMLPGGSAYLSTYLRASINTSFATHVGIMAFLVLDPTLAAPADPRLTLPVNFYAPGIGRVMSRTGWASPSTERWLTFLCAWNQVDHQQADGFTFDFWRKGNWLTKQVTGYGVGIGSGDSKNSLSLENTADVNLPLYNKDNQIHGGQYILNDNGDPSVVQSFGTGYAYAQANGTNLFNMKAGFATRDILHASRSLFWLKPDLVFVYDRAQSGTVNRYKRFCLNAASVPTVAGLVGTINAPGNQTLYVTTLLPVGATMAATGLPDYTRDQWIANEVPALHETMAHRLVIEDPALPSTVRFLHVLEGADAAAPRTAPTLIQSSAGNPFDGVLAGGVCVLFKNDITAAFTTTAFQVPTAGLSAVYVSGLTPGAGYAVATATAGANTQFTITASGSVIADSGGVIEAL